MFNKLHKNIYKISPFLKYFYTMCLSFATIAYFFERTQIIWSIIIAGIIALFNYYILITPKE